MINQTVKGDLIKMAGDFDAIVHGCNAFCTMGAGIALSIRKKWPTVLDADKQTIPGDRSKLGTFTSCKVNNQLTIINAYTQYDFSGVNYYAVQRVFERINHDFSGKNIGIPMIGAGLAGGDWKRLYHIIDSVTPDLNITLVVLEE